ncbi:hypothetical protein VNO78_18795 [Psophocarpus tetragonolobus]|uniref:Uncharacterized protein n=1 Tax=Psophocarpus tetragonolobus TaxID=3891 RepID=A0AAN9S7J3_PSOTE
MLWLHFVFCLACLVGFLPADGFQIRDPFTKYIVLSANWFEKRVQSEEKREALGKPLTQGQVGFLIPALVSGVLNVVVGSPATPL